MEGVRHYTIGRDCSYRHLQARRTRASAPLSHWGPVGPTTSPEARSLLGKWPTQTIPADLLTKGMGRAKIQSLLQGMMIQAQGGRPSAAPVRDQTVPRYGPTVFEADGANSDTEAP